jgi:peptidoglycan/LPS O-acetylase OafA/YrhL
LGHLIAVPGVVFVFLVIPLILVVELVDGDSFLGMSVFGGWGILSHAWFFVSGFMLASNERAQQSIQRLRWVWLIAAILLTATQIAYVIGNPGALKQTPLMAYLWILTLLGWARQRWNHNTPHLQRANEAVLPFYILHQPVLLVIGYFVVSWTIPDPIKYVIIAASSFAIIIALYEFLVCRFNLLRFLFGMKTLPRAARIANSAALPQMGK